MKIGPKLGLWPDIEFDLVKDTFVGDVAFLG